MLIDSKQIEDATYYLEEPAPVDMVPNACWNCDFT